MLAAREARQAAKPDVRTEGDQVLQHMLEQTAEEAGVVACQLRGVGQRRAERG